MKVIEYILVLFKKKFSEIKVNLLSAEKKLSVTEARKIHKSKEQILKENLKKLELIRNAGKVDLDEKLVKKVNYIIFNCMC